MIRQDAGVHRLKNDHDSSYAMAKRLLQAQPAFMSRQREIEMHLANQQVAIRAADPTPWIETLQEDIARLPRESRR
jgi:hypothetical protein